MSCQTLACPHLRYSLALVIFSSAIAASNLAINFVDWPELKLLSRSSRQHTLPNVCHTWPILPYSGPHVCSIYQRPCRVTLAPRHTVIAFVFASRVLASLSKNKCESQSEIGKCTVNCSPYSTIFYNKQWSAHPHFTCMITFLAPVNLVLFILVDKWSVCIAGHLTANFLFLCYFNFSITLARKDSRLVGHLSEHFSGTIKSSVFCTSLFAWFSSRRWL